MSLSLSQHIDMLLFWHSNTDWYDYPNEDDSAMPYLTDAAPPEAVESYNYWKKWHEKSQKTGIIYN